VPPEPDWFWKELSEDKLRKPKLWGDKTWYYCSPKTGGKCNGQYRCHKPSDCEGKAHIFNGDKKIKPETEQKDEKRKLKLAKAYKAKHTKPSRKNPVMVTATDILKTVPAKTAANSMMRNTLWHGIWLRS
jgi:hypothetical protein